MAEGWLRGASCIFSVRRASCAVRYHVTRSRYLPSDLQRLDVVSRDFEKDGLQYSTIGTSRFLPAACPLEKLALYSKTRKPMRPTKGIPGGTRVCSNGQCDWTKSASVNVAAWLVRNKIECVFLKSIFYTASELLQYATAPSCTSSCPGVMKTSTRPPPPPPPPPSGVKKSKPPPPPPRRRPPPPRL